MNYYIVIGNDNIAYESIPEYSPDFPEVPVTERYSADFLKNTIVSPVSIPQNYIYNPETGEFNEPIPEIYNLINIAILKQKTSNPLAFDVINIVMLDSIKTAEEHLFNNVWHEASAVLELPAGYGIGDSYIDGEWVKNIKPEAPNIFEFVEGLMEGVGFIEQ